MTPDGWIVMILSVGSVTLLLVACLWKVLTGPPPPGSEGEELHAQTTIEPPDIRD